MLCLYSFFFFKQKTADEMRISDWSSDVCSSDLRRRDGGQQVHAGGIRGGIGGQAEVGGVVEALDGDAEGGHEVLRGPCSGWRCSNWSADGSGGRRDRKSVV